MAEEKRKPDLDLDTLSSSLGFEQALIRTLITALRQRSGTIEHLRKILKDPILVNKIIDLLMVVDSFPSPIYAPELIPEGTKVREDVQRRTFLIEDLEFIPILEGDRHSLEGKDLRPHARTLNADFGLCEGKYLLEHQKEIPINMQNKTIFLPGTLLQYEPDGHISFAYLYYRKGEWRINYLYQHSTIAGKNAVLVRLKPKI